VLDRGDEFSSREVQNVVVDSSADRRESIPKNLRGCAVVLHTVTPTDTERLMLVEFPYLSIRPPRIDNKNSFIT